MGFSRPLLSSSLLIICFLFSVCSHPFAYLSTCFSAMCVACLFHSFRVFCLLVRSFARLFVARTRATVVCPSSGEGKGRRRRRTMRAMATTGSSQRMTTRSPLTCTTQTNTHSNFISSRDLSNFLRVFVCNLLGWCIMMKHVSS